MLLLPPPAVNFVIVHTRPTFPPEELFETLFFYKTHHTDKYKECLGRFVGNPFKDDQYRAKIDKLKLLLECRGIPFFTGTDRLNWEALIEARKLDNDQKRTRMTTKARNIYHQELATINASSDLFKQDKVKVLDEKYKLTLEAINAKYEATYPKTLKGDQYK